MSDPTLSTRTIIGLEIHVQLKTRAKMFCGCPVAFDAPPNTCVCPVCLGYPGALPVINRRAFEHAVVAGLALNGRIARRTKWDRKSYYYPDLPKNYQISQYDLPLATDGFFEVSVNGRARRVRIRRAHLEEDAGKNIHDTPGCTLVDLNRAGTPLLEIVTEPDLASADEAYAFCVELHRLVTYLGISEGHMKRGQMRFEPNVNVLIECDGTEYRTPIVEIKNLNSFRSVRDAIAFESQRHVSTWQSDNGYVEGRAPNENRGWNVEKGVTEYQRPKESAHDYRYFPDPDLVPVDVSEEWLDELRTRIPELPIARRRRLVDQHALSPKDAETLVGHRETADLYDAVLDSGGPAEIVAKQFVNVWMKLAHDRDVHVVDLGVDAHAMAELARITADGTINKTAAKTVASAMADRALTSPTFESPASARTDAPIRPELPASACANLRTRRISARALARELGLIQTQDAATTQAWVDQAFAENDRAVQDALSNPKKYRAAAGFLRGQVMKLSSGQADPRLVGELIEKRLADRGAAPSQ